MVGFAGHSFFFEMSKAKGMTNLHVAKRYFVVGGRFTRDVCFCDDLKSCKFHGNGDRKNQRRSVMTLISMTVQKKGM